MTTFSRPAPPPQVPETKRAGIVSLCTILTAALLALSPALQAASVSTTTMVQFGGGPAIPGTSSTLIRDDAGITATIMTSGLTPGDTYTIWVVIFNNTAACSPPGCGGDDLAPRGGDPAVQSSVTYGTGHIISTTGNATFALRKNAGDATGANFGPGLTNPMGAEIHLVVRSHGQPIPGMIEEQISTFRGACPPNDCVDQQAAIHLPLADETSARLDRIEGGVSDNSVRLDEIKALNDRIARRNGLKP